MKTFPTDDWYNAIRNCGDGSTIPDRLHGVVPNMISANLERTCNLDCAHCEFQPEESSEKSVGTKHVATVLQKLVPQLMSATKDPFGYPPMFLHEGRIVRPWHIKLMQELSGLRPGLELGLIDNGTYVKHFDEFISHGLQLNWLDVSLDGLEVAHNAQRDPVRQQAFATAINGLQHARELVIPRSAGGRVSSLFTLTTLNHHDVAGVAELLLGDGLADTMGVTPVTPVRAPNKLIETGDAEFAIAWRQAVAASARYNRVGHEPFYVTIYRVEDLCKLARVVGPETFTAAFADALVNHQRVTFDIDGVPVKYWPLSLWPAETFLVDADGQMRTSHAFQFTLAELSSGQSGDGRDTTPYTVPNLTPTSSLQSMHKRAVDWWWHHFGAAALQHEVASIRAVLE